VFVGQVPTTLSGGAFQEVDFLEISRPCTKAGFSINNIDEIPSLIDKAITIATSGKRGPVVIEMPKNILETFTSKKSLQQKLNATFEIETNKRFDAIHIIEEINQSKKPLIISGGGVVDCENLMNRFSELYTIPVVTTLMGIGSCENSLGMIGMHGTYRANMALSQADLIIAIGTRLNDRITGNKLAHNSKLIHVDIDSGTNVKANISIHTDSRNFLQQLINSDSPRKDFSQWYNDCKQINNQLPLTSKFTAVKALETIDSYTKNFEPIVTTEVGQHQMWTAQHFTFNKTRKFITSGGLGTMGFGFPAAIGASAENPEQLVLCIAGDGSIQMNIQELATLKHLNSNLKLFIINNGYLGMVRQIQEHSYNKNYYQTKISNPDFCKLAESYGIDSYCVTNENELRITLTKILTNHHPALINIFVPQEENVYPWITAEESIDNILHGN